MLAHAILFCHFFVAVQFVFNITDNRGTLSGPKLDAGEQLEGDVVAFKETPDIAGNNSPQRLNNTKLDKNGNHALEEDHTHGMQVLVKQESLDGKHFSGVDVISSKNSEISGTALEERSTTGAKNVGSGICEKKDKCKDIKLPVSKVCIEKGVKHKSKSRDLDDAPSNGVEDVKESIGCLKYVKPTENTSPLDEKSVSLPKESSKSGHVEDVDGRQKDSKVNRNPNALQGKLSQPKAFSSSEKEKSGSTHRKDSFGAHKDKKDGGNLSFSRVKTSRTNVVSCDVTQRPSSTNVSPEETSESPLNKDFEGSGHVAKPVQSLSISKKRPLEMNDEESKEKSNLGHYKSSGNKEKKLASNPCPNDEGYIKKAKLDNFIKQSEENKNNNNIKKLKEKTYVDPQNSPKVAICGDNNVKSRTCVGPSKDHNEKKKNHVGEMKNSPKSLTCDDRTKSKLCDGPSKENDNMKDDKLSNDNLSNRIATNCKDDGGKVGGKIIEVTRRPPVS